MFLLIQAVIFALPLAALLVRGARYAWTMTFEPRNLDGLHYQRASLRYSGRSDGMALRFAIPLGVRFSIWRENWFDRLCKKLGLGREAETGDAYFDKRFFFDCDDPLVLAEFGAKPALARLMGTFDARLNACGLEPGELRARDGTLEVLLRGRNKDGATEEQQAVAFLVPLLEALGRIPPRLERYRDRTRVPRLLFAGVWCAGIIGAGFVWGLCSDRLVEPKALFRASVPFSLAALAMALVFSARWIGAGGRRHVILFFCTLIGLPGFVLCGFLFARALDLALPQAQPEAIPVQAHLFVTQRRRMGTVYEVGFDSERHGVANLSPLVLSGDEYDRLSGAWGSDPKRPATLLRHAGALGSPWVEIVLDQAR